MLDSAIVRIVNNWLHDVGTGLWAACLLAIAVVGRKAIAAGFPVQAAVALRDVQWLLFWLMVAALVDIALTGGLRLAYWRKETTPAEMPSKRPALIGKHVAFLLIYGGGTAWALHLLGVL
jgi:hypothetical protein